MTLPNFNGQVHTSFVGFTKSYLALQQILRLYPKMRLWVSLSISWLWQRRTRTTARLSKRTIVVDLVFFLKRTSTIAWICWGALNGPKRGQASLAVTGSPCNPFSTKRNKRFADGSIANHSMSGTTLSSTVIFYRTFEPEVGNNRTSQRF